VFEPPTPNFRGFGTNVRLERRVPAVDARARLTIPETILEIKKATSFFLWEMVQSTRSFAANNVSFTYGYFDQNNGPPDLLLGATPSAWNAEATFHFTLVNNPSSFT
jgi:hypothetical protein